MINSTYGIKLDSLDSALSDLEAGKPIILMDNPGREGEGDFIASAKKIDPEWMKFILDTARGAFIAIFMPEEEAIRFDLPEQVVRSENQESSRTNFRLTVDSSYAHSGCTAAERAQAANILGGVFKPYETINNNKPFHYENGDLELRDSTKEDLVRPGHVVPIVGNPGGLHKRQGHTETGIELMKLANINPPVAVDMEILDLNDPYKMASPEYLRTIADKFDLKLISTSMVCERLGIEEIKY